MPVRVNVNIKAQASSKLLIFWSRGWWSYQPTVIANLYSPALALALNQCIILRWVLRNIAYAVNLIISSTKNFSVTLSRFCQLIKGVGRGSLGEFVKKRKIRDKNSLFSEDAEWSSKKLWKNNNWLM